MPASPPPLSPRPLPRTLRLPLTIRLLPRLHPLLLSIQHETKHIERKLRVLETHFAETALGLVPQHVRALAPEGGHGSPDGGVGARRVAVDVARVGEFRGGGGGDEVDFGVGEGFEGLGCRVELDLWSWLGVFCDEFGWGGEQVGEREG